MVRLYSFFLSYCWKDLVAVLLFLCGMAQLNCTWLKEPRATFYLDICAFPSLFNSAWGVLHSLGPVGDSLLSRLTSMPLLCLLVFSFKNIKMEQLHPFIKFLPTSSEILWMILFLTAVIVSIHFHLLLVKVLLCMALPALSCWSWLHQLLNRLRKGSSCIQRPWSMSIYTLIQAPVVSVKQESSNWRKSTITIKVKGQITEEEETVKYCLCLPEANC